MFLEMDEKLKGAIDRAQDALNNAKEKPSLNLTNDLSERLGGLLGVIRDQLDEKYRAKLLADTFERTGYREELTDLALNLEANGVPFNSAVSILKQAFDMGVKAC